MLEESTGNFSATRNVYDWYQTNTHVIINIMIKNLKEADVKVKLIDETLDVTCNLADGSIFKLHFNLFKPIYVQDSNWSVTPSKLEIKLKKTDRKRWQSLEQIPEKNNKRHSHPNQQSNQQHLYTSTPLIQHQPAIGFTNSTSSSSSPLIRPTISMSGLTNNNKATLSSSSSTSPKPCHNWWQNETYVFINVQISNLNQNDVKVNFRGAHLEVCCNCEDGNIYKLELELNKPIVPEESSYSLSTSKLELKIKKANKGRWTHLEATPFSIRNTNDNAKQDRISSTLVEIVDDPTPLPIESIPDGANFETVESTPVENDVSQESQKQDRSWDMMVKDVEEVVGGDDSKSMGLEIVHHELFHEINQKEGCLTVEKVEEEHIPVTIVDNLTTLENSQPITTTVETGETSMLTTSEGTVHLTTDNGQTIQVNIVNDELTFEQVEIKSGQDTAEKNSSSPGKFEALEITKESPRKVDEIVQKALEKEGILVASEDYTTNDSDSEEPRKKSRLKDPDDV